MTVKRLYLMRHGHSPSLSEAGVARDAQRPLSGRGREDARRMAAELARRGGTPALILHSPLKRAVETAAEAASVLRPALGCKPFPLLDNTRPAEAVVAELRLQEAEELLAVGHQPQIGEIAVLLAGTLFDFRPGTIVALELGEKPAALWSAGPHDL